MFRFLNKKRQRRRAPAVRRRARRRISQTARKHYLEHKESAREFILGRLHYWNQHYQFTIGQVRIKVTTSRWGSCSSNGNLNFNYQIFFLPADVADYIIVHELCHLGELNHSPAFWALVAETIPDYKEKIKHLHQFHPLQVHIQAKKKA